MKLIKLILVVGMLGLAAPFALATENTGPCEPGPSGGGGDVPIPFTVNQHAELADGESYLLIGRVVGRGDHFYFQVDLGEHAWLANARRKASPFYPLEGSSDYWRKLEGAKLKLPATAHGVVYIDDLTGRYAFELTLDALTSKIEMLEPPSHSSSRRRRR